MELTKKRIKNLQEIDWSNKDEVKAIKWDDRNLNPLNNMHNIWITQNLANKEFSLFMDEPTLEEDGIWRSNCGRWCELDINWLTSIRQGECKHYKLFEEIIKL